MYHIAGHLLTVMPPSNRKNPDISQGFLCFRSEKTNLDEKPLLYFDTNITLSDWMVEPLHRFLFEPFICDFSKEKEVYLFRMALPDNQQRWLVKIYPEGNTFRAVSNLDHSTPDYVLRFVLWIAFGVAALHRQTVAIHSSAIMHSDKSVLFLGESGTGKSTHAQLWLNHIPDTELLNDDSPFLNAAGNIRVYGSPWSGKTPCYKNLHTPLAAIVRLQQAPHNKIRKMGNLEAIGALLPSFPPEFAYDKTLSGHIHDILSKILLLTPVYALECLPDTAATELVFNTLKQDGRL